MSEEKSEPLWKLMGLLFKSHPWHGVSIGSHAPEVVTAYIEIIPTDTVKYELDKTTGHLKIDRPQRFSNITPCLYGFIPQTFCGEKVAEMCAEKTGRFPVVGDQDPMDICVLAEKAVSHGDILLQAIPIGGLRMIDRNEADDKIVAVLEGDATYGGWRDITECPQSVVDRLKHYFLTYKNPPDSTERVCEITDVYNAQEAHQCIRRSHEDYLARFGDIEAMLTAALRG